MKKMMLIVLLTVVSLPLSAQNSAITYPEAQKAWQYAQSNNIELYDFVYFMTSIKLAGFYDMEMFFWAFDQFKRSSVRMGKRTVLLDFLSYMIELAKLDMRRSPNFNDYYGLVFSDDKQLPRVRMLAKAMYEIPLMNSALVQPIVQRNLESVREMLGLN